MSTNDVADRAVEAMREDGQLPRWAIAVNRPRVEPETEAQLQLAPDLVLHVRQGHYGIMANISIGGLMRETDLDAVLSTLPGKLAPQFEQAARELKRLDSMTPRVDAAGEGGGE